MKYTLINCYADNNKGDLGIILSTIDWIKAIDAFADIQAVSTFNYSDPNFRSQHEFLRNALKVLPAVFGELNLGEAKGRLSKGVRFIIDSIRLFAYCLIPDALARLSDLLFSRAEKDTLKRIRDSDHIVSKGGSFLCNERNARSKIALIRFLFIFLVCFRHKKKVTILCQSLGPVYGAASRGILNYVLRKCENIVLREDVCIKSYTYLSVGSNPIRLNDIAFFLDCRGVELPEVEISSGCLKIGVTIKHVDKQKSAQYLEMMASGLAYCVKEYGAHIYVFPHVTIENDISNAYNVLEAIADRHKHKITVFSDNYTPQQLKKLYSQMDVFIGTRLHSTIFAIGELVPSVCISYHGTKSIGIFSNFHLEEYVVTEYSPGALRERIDKVILNRRHLRDAIRACLEVERDKFSVTMSALFLGGRQGRPS